MTEPVLPPTAAELAQLRAQLDEMKKSKDADLARIERLEAKVDAQEKSLADARKKVHEVTGGLLDLF